MSKTIFSRFPRARALAVGLLLLPGGAGLAQDATVPVTFLPPPLEGATYSLGIYEANSRRLVRRLHEFAPESAFAAGLNGLITRWDRRDDAGRLVPPGRYTGRGYAVRPLQIAGVAFHGNDWVEQDENLRVKHVDSIRLAPDGRGLLASVKMADDAPVELTLAPDGEVSGRRPAPSPAEAASPQDASRWTAQGEAGVIQRAADGAILRRLAPVPGDPLPRAVVAATGEDRIYLLEEKDGWQRLRALVWVDAREENGQPVSTWQTVFERNIRRPEPPPATRPVDLALGENPLSPGRPSHVHLSAAFDAEGSYLQTVDGLRLRRISDRSHLTAAWLVRGEGLAFFQTDAAASDEFSIAGASEMMTFDAGEIELTPAGEKPPPAAPEPPGL